MEKTITEKLLSAIIETSNNNITIADGDGIILQSNPEHWIVYNVSPDEFKGKSIFLCILRGKMFSPLYYCDRFKRKEAGANF